MTNKTGRKPIAEESGEHKAWMIEAKKMTVKELPEFVRKLCEDYQHDYGTICHAIAAAAIGAANAVNTADSGGITGFQAGAVMWEMIRGWGVWGQNPMRIVDFGDLLYPQYEYKFQTITPATWKWVQEKARELLAADEKRGESRAADRVAEHWRSVAQGNIPFGLRIAEK